MREIPVANMRLADDARGRKVRDLSKEIALGEARRRERGGGFVHGKLFEAQPFGEAIDQFEDNFVGGQIPFDMSAGGAGARDDFSAVFVYLVDADVFEEVA